MKVLDLAKERDFWVFSDECYEQLTYDLPYVSTAMLAENSEKVLTFQSCSKTYLHALERALLVLPRGSLELGIPSFCHLDVQLTQK